MKITYRREIKHNYLIIDPEDLEWEGYESRMLSQNPVEGLLELKIRHMEQGVRFYYEITSKQPLIRLLQNQKLRAGEIRSLMIGIFGTLERMEGYLLRENHILLDPEYFYIDPDNFRIGLCLVPGLERDFIEDFGKLLERVLESVDHQDKESVVLAYGLYQETRKENYGIENVMRLLYQEKDQKPRRGQAYQEGYGGGGAGGREGDCGIWDDQNGRDDRNGRDGQNNRGGRNGRNDRNGWSDWNDRDDRGGQNDQSNWNNRNNQNDWSDQKAGMWKETVYSGKKTDRADGGSSGSKVRQQRGWRGRLANWFAEKFRSGHENMPVQVPWEIMFHEEDEQQPGVNREFMVKQPDNADQGTVLLADLTEDNACRVLRAMDAGMEDIKISYYPFIIGKQEHLVDYCLDRDTVSRLHLRIDRNGSHYQVQDLNSTNGTVLRGKLMENNETNEIRIGDEISIARFRYRFE